MFQNAIDLVFPLTREEIAGVFVVLGWALLEFVFRTAKSRIKSAVYEKNVDPADPRAGEYYIEYYRKSQVIDLIRIGAFLVAAFSLVLYRIPSAANFFVVATGAVIITFKDIILSFAAFFYVVSQYRVGESITIGGAKGEIIYIRPMYVGIVGKDENAEHTGELNIIPNNRFLAELVKKEELRTVSYRKETFRIPFRSKEFPIAFAEFAERLEEYLKDHLPLRTAKQVGHYRSFIGCRYKADYGYDDKGGAYVEISFIGRSFRIPETKKGIVSFVESMKAVKPESGIEMETE